MSVEFWDPKSQKWGQAHCQARFAILKVRRPAEIPDSAELRLVLIARQCFLEAGDGFCTLESSKDDLSDLTIKLDRSKILTTGRKGTQCVTLSYKTYLTNPFHHSRWRLLAETACI
jgi:dipeptidyl-peptidase III